MKLNVPEEVAGVAQTLVKSGFQAYLVGGCVRDVLIERVPKDWDIATDAKPEEILRLFPDSVYENNFGTVGVKVENKGQRTENEGQRTKDLRQRTEVVEVTTFRKEGKYTDKRHPDSIVFAKTIEEDLARRDFTINAMALNMGTSDVLKTSDVQTLLVDPYGGREDLEKKLIRTVGRAEERFGEDALRLMRAVRFAVELSAGGRSGSDEPSGSMSGPASGWGIEEKTAAAILKLSNSLKEIAMERIRDEFQKVIMADEAMKGVQMLEDLGLLKHIITELRDGIGCGQNLHHIYSVWEHNVRALDYAAKQGYGLEIRLAALLHDIGKPKTKRGDGKNSTFYGHEVVGARMAKAIMERLRFSKEITDMVTHLVRHHLFYYNVGEVSEAGVRRFLARVGPENIDDLVKIREADRIGSGVPKAKPYKIRHLLFMIDKVRRDPLSPKMLKVNGEDVMKILGISPGPRIGWILSALMDEVLEEPSRNKIKDLGFRIKELGKLSDKELQGLAKKGKEKIAEEEAGIEGEMKRKHHV
ncbi:MAG: HD domain-containing protein [bacterium]|nr:HD domain-containing protein [bacterium]